MSCKGRKYPESLSYFPRSEREKRGREVGRRAGGKEREREGRKDKREETRSP